MSGQRFIPINKPTIGRDEVNAVINVLRTGMLTDRVGAGKNVSAFEEAYAKYIGCKYGAAVNSGTAALHSSIMALGIGPGDEVIVPSFTFVSTAEVVAVSGAMPVFVDIDPETYCMSPESMKMGITSKTKAVIPVHLYGLTANMKPIVEEAHKRHIAVIEDAAQAHGAQYMGQMAGNLGDLGCFSFYASKVMTTGEGGMVTTSKKSYVERIRLVRDHGEGSLYSPEMFGYNYRMPEMEGAIGLVQLRKIPRILEARRRNAKILSEELKGVGELELPVEPKGYSSCWNVYTVRLRGARAGKRNKVVQKIRDKGIGVVIYYPTPIHLIPYYMRLYDCRRGDLPETEKASNQVFSLPVHQSLSKEDLMYIVDTLKKVLAS